MVPALACLACTPVAALPFDAPLPDAPQSVDALVADSASYLLEIAAYTGRPTAERFPPLAVATAPVAALPFGTAIEGETVTLRLSDRGWVSPYEEVAEPVGPVLRTWRDSRWYEARLDEEPQLDQEIPVTPEAGTRSGLSAGRIRLNNLDGALDVWPDLYTVAGRKLRVLKAVYERDRLPNYADHSLLYEATMADWLADEETLEIEIGGARVRLQNPAQNRIYQGTGGEEGDALWAGVRMPMTFGEVFNIEGDLIVAATLTYRLHSGRIRALLDCRDRGISLNYAGDFADYAALAAASLSAGQYASCLAEGLARLHSLNEGSRITWDLEGDVDGRGLFADSHAAIARRVLALGGIGDAGLASGTFARDWPAGRAGLFLPSIASAVGARAVDAGGAPSIAEVLDRLAASVAGWWGEDETGAIAIGRLRVPAAVESILDFGPLDFRGRIEALDLPAPRCCQRVGYRLNWTVQTDFAGAVSDADRQRFGQDYQETSASDAEVAARHFAAAEPETLVSLFKEEIDALALAQLLLALHGPDRRLYRLPVGPKVALTPLGQTVVVTYPRGGFGAGKAVQVVGRSLGDGEVTVWG